MSDGAPVLTGLHVYPVKSCRGLSLESVEVDERGPRHDREWMIVDEEGRFVTQRQEPRLALVDVALDGEALELSVEGTGRARAPLEPPPSDAPVRRVVVWRSTCDAVDEGDEAAGLLSEHLGRAVRLVRMAPAFRRRVNPDRVPDPSFVGFADGYPFLLIGEASLADLNARLDAPLEMARFRPNLVVAGAAPYAEDGWQRFRLGGIPFEHAKPCDRCAIPTIDPATGRRGREPLATLARYRRGGDSVLFGVNLVHRAPGTLHLGTPVR